MYRGEDIGVVPMLQPMLSIISSCLGKGHIYQIVVTAIIALQINVTIIAVWCYYSVYLIYTIRYTTTSTSISTITIAFITTNVIYFAIVAHSVLVDFAHTTTTTTPTV